MGQLKICFVSSEIVPFAKTGGLADVAGALGKYLHKLGHDIRLILPLYSSVDTRKNAIFPVDFAQNCEIWCGSHSYRYSVFTGKLPDSGCPVYFIHCAPLYNRRSLYTDDADEHIRFSVLSRAAIELCQKMGWAPHIFHCNDWQTALIPLYLKTHYSWDKLFANSRTVLTIHNIGYQGRFQADVINDLGLSSYYEWFDPAELYAGSLNFLKTGLLYADRITTVSETYASEIQTPDFGEGLQDILRNRRGDLTGILNGVDYDEWNPETDPRIPFKYSASDLRGKTENKKVLMRHLGLEFRDKAPVLGMITRLAEQKGIDLLYGTLETILSKHDIRFVVLGSGAEQYERHLYHTQLNFQDKMVFYRGYNNDLAHLIEAGADIFVMPSRYEPCGLNQVYSLKYGTIPVVRKTGGLADTVELYNWETREGTGFSFEHYTPEGLLWALEYAISTYANKEAWAKLIQNAMAKDFSWDHQIPRYISMYEDLLK